jgi:hypothetical protein
MKQNLAEQITAILSNPETPADLFNSIHESVLNMADETRVQIVSPEILPHALPLMLARLQAQEERTSEPVSACARAANIVADLLESEDTPEVLRSALIEFCSELSNHVSQGNECACSPETTRKHLPAMLERAKGWRVSNGGIMFNPSKEDTP